MVIQNIYTIDTQFYIKLFNRKLNSYTDISQESWELIESIITFTHLKKDEMLLEAGEKAKYFYYVCKGALRSFISDNNGDTYNKNLFLEDYFAGSKVSLINGTPSKFSLQAIEDTILIGLPYMRFKELIYTCNDLKNFYIAYLERHWIFEKEQREVSLVMENATERYLKLIQLHPDINNRIPQLHIAAHLGITPTQLSRIRKQLKKDP